MPVRTRALWRRPLPRRRRSLRLSTSSSLALGAVCWCDACDRVAISYEKREGARARLAAAIENLRGVLSRARAAPQVRSVLMRASVCCVFIVCVH
jgi:hypothetical protein